VEQADHEFAEEWLCSTFQYQMSHGKNASMGTRLLFIVLAIFTLSFLGIAI
jgi:hypothetical protein